MEFPQGTDKKVFLENAYFIDFISLQIKHELATLVTTAEAGYKIMGQALFHQACVRVHLQKGTNNT